MTNKLFIIFFTIFLFSLVNAQLDVTKDNINVNGINIIPPLPPPFDNNTGNVNSSDFWDDLDTPADININDLNYSFTDGSVIFSDGVGLAEDNGNLFWDDVNNRLGIGTNSPTDRLHVRGTNPIINVHANTPGSGLELKQSSDATGSILLESAGLFTIGTSNNNDLSQIAFVSRGEVEAMRLDEDGKLGIGTNNPSRKLHVEGDVNLNDTLFVDNDGRVGVGTNNPQAIFHLDGDAIIDTDTGNNPFTFTRLGSLTESMELKITDTSAFFTMVQDESQTGSFIFRSGGTSGSNTAFDIQRSSSGSLFHVTHGGNVGIATPNPTHRFNVVGDSNFSGNVLMSSLDVRGNVNISNGTDNFMFINGTSGFVTFGLDVNITGGLIVGQNVTASFFKGDGSELTGIAGGIWTNVSGTATYTDDVNITGDLYVGNAVGDQILIQDGNSVSPGIAFASDTNLGIGRVATGGKMAFYADGASRVQINFQGLSVLPNGNKNTPSIFLNNVDTNTGIWRQLDDMLNLGAGGIEFIRLKESTQDELIINDEGVDIDFRIESDTNTHAFFMDGATGFFNVTENTTFKEDVIINGILYGGSPVEIAGINITDNIFMLEENINRSLDFNIQNLNNGSNASATITAKNDVGGTMLIGIGSSNFIAGDVAYPNMTGIFSRSRGDMVFANFFNKVFIWLTNPSDDNDPNNLVEIMRLDENGLNVTGNTNIEGNLTVDTNTLFVDSDNNRVGIGTTTPLAPLEIQSLAASMRQTRYSDTGVQSAGLTVQRSGGTTVGTDVIVQDGWRIANFNLRGYDGAAYRTAASIQAFIDGTPGGGDMPGRLTFLTTADGASSATERMRITSTGRVGIGTTTPTHELNVIGNVNATGNITSENVFIPSYIFAHDNTTMVLASANEWTNITFYEEEAEIKKGINHTFNDNTNHTFTITKDGIYNIDYNLDVIDTSASSTDIDVAARIIYSNGTEIDGSVFETDITKKNIENELSHSILAHLLIGDVIVFQFIAQDVDVEVSTHGTFGDKPESVSIRIEKIANIR